MLIGNYRKNISKVVIDILTFKPELTMSGGLRSTARVDKYQMLEFSNMFCFDLPTY